MPRLASPAEKTVLTTAIGASAPRRGLRYFGSIGMLFLRGVEAGNPLLHFRFRRIGRIEVRLLRLFRDTWNKRLVVIDARPRALVDQEIVETRAPARSVVPYETGEERLVAAPHLPQEQRIHDFRGLDDVRERFTLVLRQRGNIRAEIGRREAGDFLFEIPGRLRRDRSKKC